MKRRTKAGEAAWKGFEDLRAWQLAWQLMVEYHKLADALPAKERYDLAPQIECSKRSELALSTYLPMYLSTFL